MKINSFEDLRVWQKGRELVNLLYDITALFPREERFSIVDQIRRAALSFIANIAEGFSRFHLAETVMFYRNARGSLAEVKSFIYICLDRKYINEETATALFSKVDELGKMINGLINATELYRKKQTKL